MVIPPMIDVGKYGRPTDAMKRSFAMLLAYARRLRRAGLKVLQRLRIFPASSFMIAQTFLICCPMTVMRVERSSRLS